MAITASLNGNITVTDGVTGTVAFTKLLTALATVGSVWNEASTVAIGTSPTSITLPVSPANFLYIKNLHATQTLAVSWTPNGGASNPVVTLQPGSAIIIVEGLNTSGITALSVTGSGAGTTVEYLIAG
jgi:hypothetical protein